MTEELETNIIDLGKLDNVRPNGDGSWQAACPVCRNEGSDKTGNHLRIYPSKAFHCAKYKKDKQHNASIIAMAGTLGVMEAPSSFTEPNMTIEEIYDDSILKKLTRDFDYWIGRGLSAATLEQFEGGVAMTGKMKNRYVFPLRDRNNKIHGFTGRYLWPISDLYQTPRWKHLGKKENWVWDRKNTISSISETGIAILVEGPGCPLALREVGIGGVLPIFGVVPSSKLIALIISLNPKKIVISLNNELGNTKAVLNGNEAASRTFGILSNYFDEKKLIVRLPDKKDWLDCNNEQRLKFKSEIFI